MKANDIITYCIDNYGYVECINLPYGQELQYCQGGINLFFLSILEFDTEDDTFSILNQPDRYRLSLCLSKDEYNKLFSRQCPYDAKYVCSKGCDFAAKNIVMPHPVKANECYIQCISPDKEIFEKVLKELISLSYKRARQEYLNRR